MVEDSVAVLPLQADNTEPNIREATKTADSRLRRPHESINRRAFEWSRIAPNQRFEEILTDRRINSNDNLFQCP